jgi:NAD(P)-dependent dehydrogenase (short-subunit alcohol dehydrogenase family)
MRLHERPSLVVTGGSSGIGAAVCLAAARSGWHVWVGYATGGDRAATLAAEIRELGHSASIVALPLDNPAVMLKGVERMARPPMPAAAILCGGPAPDISPFPRLAPDHFRYQLECAVVGHSVLIGELWRQCFRRRSGGHILAVLSAAQGPATAPYMASYVAAKGGFEALLRAAAAELGRAGLRVSVVRPGFVETPMLDVFEPRLLDLARQSAPARRFLQPTEVAEALLAGLLAPPAPGAVAELPLGQARVAFA